MRWFPVVALAALVGCKANGSVEPPLVNLANRLYLAGNWEWADTVRYTGYIPTGSGVPHFGWYIVSGTATLEDVDSTDVETYALASTAQIVHVDSAGTNEIRSWTITDISYEDTVVVRNDSISGLAVEIIPPEAGATTNLIKWMFTSDQLWCTNWLTDSLPVGNADRCMTTVTWVKTGNAAPGLIRQ